MCGYFLKMVVNPGLEWACYIPVTSQDFPRLSKGFLRLSENVLMIFKHQPRFVSQALCT